MSVYQTQVFYPQSLLVTILSVYQTQNFAINHCWLPNTSISGKTFYPHALLFAMCHYIIHYVFPQSLLFTLYQYIKGKNFNFTRFWQHCVSISETTFISAHILVYNVSVYHTHFYLHCVSISDTTDISSLTVGYTVSVYQGQ